MLQSPGELWNPQIPKPMITPIKSESLKVGLRHLGSVKLPWGFQCVAKSENHLLESIVAAGRGLGKQSVPILAFGQDASQELKS